MSEYQNKAVELLTARHGEEDAENLARCRDAFLRDAIEIYKVLGGTPQQATQMLRDNFPKPGLKVTDAIGEVMGSIAGISRISDVDMMQAAYNSLEHGWRALNGERAPRAKIRLRG